MAGPGFAILSLLLAPNAIPPEPNENGVGVGFTLANGFWNGGSGALDDTGAGAGNAKPVGLLSAVTGIGAGVVIMGSVRLGAFGCGC